MRMGKPEPFWKRAVRSTSNSREVEGMPPASRQIFAVVPPMSKEIALSSPFARATTLASTAPPAGPDSTRRMGNCRAVSRSVSPPPEVISSVGQRKPRAASLVWRLPR
jgi:hypothetical protein